MSKPILYFFGGSVWSAAAELAAHELYPEGAIDFKVVNLVEGENFDPAFLKINPKGTLATLRIGDTAYTSTAEVVSYLVKNSATKVTPGTSLTDLVHEDAIDPNFSLLLARNDEELKAKGQSVAGIFLSHRQAALDKYAAYPDAAAFKEFYESKIASNGAASALYQGKASAEEKEGFFAQSQAHYERVEKFLYETLPTHLPASGFIGGATPGEDDYHVGAWLTRIASVAGATSAKDGLKAFDATYVKSVPENVASYWNAWSTRDSWKKVYAEAFH